MEFNLSPEHRADLQKSGLIGVGVNHKDFEDVRLSRPVSVTDLWDIDDRISRLEDIAARLEKVLEAFILLYREERVKTWEMILKKMLEQEQKKGNHGNRTG